MSDSVFKVNTSQILFTLNILIQTLAGASHTARPSEGVAFPFYTSTRSTILPVFRFCSM